MYNKFEMARILGTCNIKEDVFRTVAALNRVRIDSGNDPEEKELIRKMSNFRLRVIINTTKK
ncbi:MAG: hypothetical protein CMM93_08570 [Rickettsiales bacterium]|nr:hypothetical protein [Rickettsiales bacterium]